MAETTAIVSQPDVTQEYKVDVGEVALAISGTVIATLMFILLMKGKIGFFKARIGHNTLEAGGKTPPGKPGEKTKPGDGVAVFVERRQIDERQIEIDEAIDVLIDRKHQVERKIMAAQIRTIRDHADSFDELFPKTDRLVLDSLWNKFTWELYMTAVENHVLTHVKAGRVDQDYLDDKVFPIRQGHKKLIDQYPIRAWEEVEVSMGLLMRMALDEFVSVAKREWNDFNESVEALRSFIGQDHPMVAKRVKRLLEDTSIAGSWDKT